MSDLEEETGMAPNTAPACLPTKDEDLPKVEELRLGSETNPPNTVSPSQEANSTVTSIKRPPQLATHHSAVETPQIRVNSSRPLQYPSSSVAGLPANLQARMQQFQASRVQKAHQQQNERPSATSWASDPSIKRANKPGLGARRGLKLPMNGELGSTVSQQSNQSSMFNNFSNIIDTSTGTLNFAGKASLHAKGIDFSSGSSFEISKDDLDDLGELGRGNYGTVHKVFHRPTKVTMAMKAIRLELDQGKLSAIIMELEILHKAISPYIVEFYGAFFVEGAVGICMEYMDGGSMDKLYEGGVEEGVVAKIAIAVVEGLRVLKDEHNIIHRDVKPTNVLVNTKGDIKLCDFGVSGNLVASIAKTNIGCQSYMAPERIKSNDPTNASITYTVHSDIWSLGLSLLEIAKGHYPYPPETYNNIFSQLQAIVEGEPPDLPSEGYSKEARDFIRQCLNKTPAMRPSYATLAAHPWLGTWKERAVDVKGWVQKALVKLEKKRESGDRAEPTKPALHRVTLNRE